MKKLILSIALLSGIGLFCNANTMNEGHLLQTPPDSTISYVDNDGFAPAKLETLPTKVQEVIKKNYTTFNVKSIAFHAEKKLTKVTLTAKADGTEKVVILDEQGNETK